MKQSTFTTLILGLAFFFLFFAFNTAQNLLTSVLADNFGNLGFYSLCVVYASNALFMPLAPHFVRTLGERKCLIAASCAFCLFLAGQIRVWPPVVYVASVLNGVAAAVLWTAQGCLLTKTSDQTSRTSFAGVLWSLFQASTIVGNLTAYLVLQQSVAYSWLIAGLTVVAVVGTLIFAALPSANQARHFTALPADVDTASELQHERTLTLKSDWKTFKLLLSDRTVLLLLPLEFFIGLEISFLFGSFTTLLVVANIPLVMMVFGIGEVLGSVLWGRIGKPNETAGGVSRRKILFCVALLIHAVALTGVEVYKDLKWSTAPSDSCYNVLYLSATASAFRGHEHSVAFAISQFGQSSGLSTAFALFSFFPIVDSLVPVVVVALTGLFACTMFFFARIGRGDNTMDE